MNIRWINLFLISALLAGCAGGVNLPAAITATPNLPTPNIQITRAPEVTSDQNGFLEAWKAEDYPAMYGYLTQSSQQTIAVEDFAKRYTTTMNALGLKSLRFDPLSNTLRPEAAQITLRVTYETNLMGDLAREITFPWQVENGKWRLSWDDGLVMPELRGGNYLSMDYQTPSRGEIFDRNGNTLVSQTEAVALGVNPSQINQKQEATLINELANLTGQTPGEILSKYQNYYGQDWYVPIGEASLSETNKRYGVLAGLGGLVMNNYASRFYWNGGIAPQVTGYTGPLQPEQLNEYLRKGYALDARIGQAGVERWADPTLAGKSGGTLYLVNPAGSIITYLGRSEPQQGASLALTIDRNLQIQTQQALKGFRGAIVVMERDSGRILAMASGPDYDPNLFDAKNYNSYTGLGILVNDTNTPLVNRATQGQYPLGSVFKIITMAAALESNTFTAQSTYECGYEYTELKDRILYDWTWDRYQAELRTTGEGKTQPSGTLTLPEGLMRSCNPWFYHIGYDLYRQGRVTAIADMARGFGLGQPSGIQQLAELPGSINNPPTILDAVNQSIGQGDMLVTPLQVAAFTAAVGNGGTLYRPQVIEKAIGPDGVETQLFKPEARSTLPVTPEHLKLIQDSMRNVIANPRGTASHRFRNFEIPVSGKTGTAETGIPGSPHSWFAGYTEASANTNLPDIAVVVIAEFEGEGSEFAAQIFRRVIEIYYFGRPRRPYSWETSIGVTRTPTPFGFEGTATVKAGETP